MCTRNIYLKRPNIMRLLKIGLSDVYFNKNINENPLFSINPT